MTKELTISLDQHQENSTKQHSALKPIEASAEYLNQEISTNLRKVNFSFKEQNLVDSSCINQCDLDHTDYLGLIDSRSIIINKTKLKRFWERRIEMDFKLKQGQRSISNGTLLRDARSKVSSGGKHFSLHGELDENNNDNKPRTIFGAKENQIGNLNKDVQETPRAKSIDEESKKVHDTFEQRLEDVENVEYGAEILPNANGYHLGQRRQGSKSPNEENQLMSIDPTLCHARAKFTNQHLQQQESGERLNTNDDQQDELREEQFTDEDFSSSSSSFGPMSISTITRSNALAHEQSNSVISPRQDELCVVQREEQCRLYKLPSAGTSDEDEQSSARSGSDVTVINAKTSSNDESGRSHERQPIKDQSSDDCHEQLNSKQSSEIDETTDEIGTNIGVAFESLQFDDEIKSSKNEIVDEVRLLRVPKLSTGIGNKFNPKQAKVQQSQNVTAKTTTGFSSQETKSVCNFIANAVSDATRQVENLMKSSSCSSLHPFTNCNVANECKQFKKLEARAEQETKYDKKQLRPRSAKVEQIDREHNDNGRVGKSLYSSKLIIQHAKFVHHNGKTSNTNDGSKERMMDKHGAFIIKKLVDPVRATNGGDLSDEKSNNLDERSIPSTDLSSIFVANVRREIERFESNSSMIRRHQLDRSSSGDKVSSLTEWRIAEEIRSFNEREKELKQRTGGYRDDLREAPARVDQQHESIVRSGKTFRIPKLTGGHIVAKLNKNLK